MEKPLVTIIVPIYKVEKYLRRCLDSIMNQTYKNVFVILVDDGSPDKCPEICNEYVTMDRRFHVIHKQNGGLSNARNTGLEYCRNICGRGYIYFVDSDDVIYPSIIEKCILKIQETNADAVVFGCAVQYEEKDIVIKREDKIPEANIYNCNSYNEILYGPFRHMYGIPVNELAKKNQGELLQAYKRFLGVWCWMYRAEFLFKNGISFDEEVFCGEDEVFTGRVLAYAEKIASLQEVGYEYYIRSIGMARTRSYAPNIIENKILLIRERGKIRDLILERTGIDVSNWAYGSYVLSVFQLCVTLANEKHGYSKFKEYIRLKEVQAAIKSAPLKGKFKLVFPLLLCKMRCYALLFYAISVVSNLGIPVRL